MTTLLVLANPADRELARLERLPDDVRLVVGNSPEALADAAHDADAIVSWWSDRALLERVFSMAPRVRWVHATSAGVDNLLFPALIASPVPLTNARGAYSASLGEFTLASMLFFAKDLTRMRRNQFAGKWEPFDVELLDGATLAIVGYGDIGQAIARLARPFGMRVLALRRRPDLSNGDPLVDRAYPPAEILAMLAESDYVAVAAPLTPSTRGLIGERELNALKPGAVLVNVGRGAVIDEAALVRSLEGKRIRGAALDVFETEPLPPDHPFWKLDTVLLSPHCADHHRGWRGRSVRVFLENLERFRLGQPLLNVVDKHAGY